MSKKRSVLSFITETLIFLTQRKFTFDINRANPFPSPFSP